MGKKIRSMILFSIILISIFSVNVMAFFPITHKYIWDQSILQPIDSDFYNSVSEYPKHAFAGNVLTDVTVIFYYTQNILYSTDHQPPFCSAIIDNIGRVPGADYSNPETIKKFKACSVGACSHQSSDLPAHSDNGLVPYAIEHSFLVNSIIHTLAEQKCDSYVERNNPGIKQETDEALLQAYKDCQPLFVTSLLGESAYQDAGLDEARLNMIFDDFISEIIGGKTGYDVSFKQKNFLGTLDAVPFSILGGYMVIMLGSLLIVILLFIKMIRRKAKIRHYIGMVVFLPVFIVLLMLFIGAVRGNAFNTFIFLIKPISELVPIGNPDTYINRAILNTKQLFLEGEIALIGTDASGRGTNPVLDVADSQVMYMDYVIFGVLGILLIVFIWFLFKKEKIREDLNLRL